MPQPFAQLDTTERIGVINLHDPTLDKDRISLLFGNSRLADAATLVMAALVLHHSGYLQQVHLVIAWASYMGVLVAARAFLAVLFTRNTHPAEDLKKWEILHVLLTILIALGCGASALIFLPGADLPAQLYLCFVISGYCAVAVLALVPGFYVSLAFTLVSLMPYAYGLLYLSTAPAVAPVTAMASLIIVMFILARHNSHYLSSLISLNHEHNKLIRALDMARRDNKEKNRDLNIEIANHQKVEKELRSAMVEAQKATKIKAEFLATMSHEIRTPMNGVLGMTELMMHTGLSNKQKRFAEAIRQSGEALLTIINDILDFSKIEAGKLELKKEAFDLRRLLEDTCAMFAERAVQRGIELACMYPVDGHTAFNSDQHRIRQILINLIGNAIKFTENGEIFVNINIEKEDAGQAQLYFEVKDTGIGVKDELADHVFDSFTQVDGSMTRRFGGTGLGLAICKKLIDLMHGTIGLRSQYGKGSIFWFRLTLEKDSLANVRNVEVVKPGSITGARILVVDDKDTNLRIMEQQITGWHAYFDRAKTAKQGLHKLYLALEQGKPFDIAILDKQLPGVNAIHLTRKIRHDQKLQDTKIIILSSVGQLEETGEWMLAGVRAYLNKPLRQSELFNCLVSVYNQDKPDLQRRSNTHFQAVPDTMEKLSGHILVAEDNLINQELITQMLQSFGCRFRFVGDGRDVVEAITDFPLDQQNDPYDLVLMDCQMPKMDGFEATGAIRRWEKAQQCSAIPVVALTANAMQGDRENCLAAGMDDYLSKPFTSIQLFTMLKKWLPISAIDSGHCPPAEKNCSTPDSTHVSTLDREAINRIKQLQRDNSADILLKIIGIYLEKGPELMQQISQAISVGDAAKLRHAAHSLKSSSASLGAMDMANLCRELESMGRENDFANVLTKLDILEFEYEGVCRALQFECERQAA